jgi:enoyl-CoA hydratase/carnithine racemase
MIRFATTSEGPVAIATMDDGENRLGSHALDAWHAALDEVLDDHSISSLVVTGIGKYWSTGLDLDEVSTMSGGEREEFMTNVDLLLGRILTLPVVTVAALNGHAYAAGGLLALAHDYRIMRDDRGFFCLPSVDVGIPFSRGMSALIAAKLPQPIAHDLVVSCRQIGGSEAAATGVVNRAVGHSSVLPAAVRLATACAGKDRSTLAAVKQRMYPMVVTALTSPT